MTFGSFFIAVHIIPFFSWNDKWKVRPERYQLVTLNLKNKLKTLPRLFVFFSSEWLLTLVCWFYPEGLMYWCRKFLNLGKLPICFPFLPWNNAEHNFYIRCFSALINRKLTYIDFAVHILFTSTSALRHFVYKKCQLKKNNQLFF